ncbi:uncharacterized protein [Pleurodeles waltl]|uniref:uncharacterized protein n=1 Tax=Pleurodeles waltl TaxID=8319 RepID=UPI0037099A45
MRRCSKKTAKAQLGMASQRGRGARRTMTPLMFRILAVAYPELDGRLRTSQQTQGASTGGGTVAPEHEGAESHMAMEGHTTDSEFTSGTEGEGSFTSATRSPTSKTDSSADGSFPVVAAPSVRPTSTGTAATSPTSTALPAAPQRVSRARSPRRVGITFAPGTSGPTPVTPAALSEEAIDLLRSLTVGQSTIVNAIQGVERELKHGNAFLEGIHSGQAVLQRTLQSLASALMTAIVPVSSLPPQPPPPRPNPLYPSPSQAHLQTSRHTSQHPKVAQANIGTTHTTGTHTSITPIQTQQHPLSPLCPPPPLLPPPSQSRLHTHLHAPPLQALGLAPEHPAPQAAHLHSPPPLPFTHSLCPLPVCL